MQVCFSSYVICYSRNNLRHGPYYNSVTVGIVCSLVFLTVGVVVGVLSVHIKNGLKKKLPASPSPPPFPPPATYEEVGVASEKAHDIQLTSNESYAVNNLQKDIPTSHNSAYGVVYTT